MLMDGQPVPDNRADVTRRLSDHIHENQHSNRYEDEMFSIKYFQKGTAHITFRRVELVDKLNDIIARTIREHWRQDERGVTCPMPAQLSQRKPDGNGILDTGRKEKTQVA